MTTRRIVKRGEALAIAPEALHSGPGAIWWDMLTPVPPNERCGSVAIVHVRGSLEHHAGFGTDSYDGILERTRCAFAGESEDETATGAPSCVVLRIDSPGGVCSGLNETVFALRRMSRESGIPLYAYVDELAASAAYALSCACDEIILPPSAICGSVGVISCLYDQVEADKKMGLRFVTLTSGARKADGHPHVAISDDALAAEQSRVDQLADQFYDIVAEARHMPAKKVAALQAGIFLAAEAESNGLADAIMGWEEMLSTLDSKITLAKLGQSESTSTAQRDTIGGTKEKAMSLIALKALIASEKDAKKKKALTASLANLEAYKKEKHTVEKHETEEGEESEEESEESEEESEESEEESEESEESKGNETDRKEKKSAKHGKKMASEDDDGGDDGDEDEDEAEAASAIASLARQATGKKGKAAIGALAAMLAQGQRAVVAVDRIEKERRTEKKASKIEAALNARRITPHEARDLRAKPYSFVQSFLEMRPKAIINIDEETIHVPDPKAEAKITDGLSAAVVKQIDEACAMAGDAKARDALRTKMVAEQHKRANGAGGRH